MSEALKVEIYFIELFHIVSIGILILFTAMMYFKAKKGPLLYALYYVNLMMLIWMVSKVLKTVSPNVDLRWFFIVTQYFAISMLEAAFLEFSYCFAYKRAFSWRTRILISILPIIQFIVVATNQKHFLFYSHYDFWGDSFGLLFYVYMVVEYIYILAGIIICGIKLRDLLKNKGIANIILIGIAILLPMVFNILFLTLTIDRFLMSIGIYFDVFDVTPIAFACSLIIFVYVTYRYSFIDLSPIMKHETIHKLNIPIVISDHTYMYIDGNETAYKKVLPYINEAFLWKIKLNSDENQVCINKEKYLVTCKELKFISKNKDTNIFIFTNITEYKSIEDELVLKKNDIQKQNLLLENKIEMIKETSSVAARNYFARELHDVIGHALVLTMRICELSILIYEEQPEAAEEKMNEAVKTVKNCFQELKKNISENNIRALSSINLKKDLEKIIQKINHTDLDVQLFFRGFLTNIDINLYDTIIRIVQESLTNVLKYAKATTAIVSIKIDEGININIIDNGKGCVSLMKGNGISGIEQRIEALNGEIKFSYGKDVGFQIVANVPL